MTIRAARPSASSALRLLTSPMRPVLLALALLLTVPLLSSCGGDEPAAAAAPADSDYEQVSEATLQPGDEVPAPTGEVVLTIRGGSTTNVDAELQLDFGLLEQMGVVRYTVFDRQAEGRNVAFSGPLLKSVLEVAGIPLDSTLNAVALNDYAVKLPAADAEEFPVMLATKSDGERMSVENYGPTRVIYPTKGYDLDREKYDPRWIWQLASIAAR